MGRLKSQRKSIRAAGGGGEAECQSIKGRKL